MSSLLQGFLKEIVYRDESKGWSVLRFEIDGQSDTVTAVGYLSAVQPGESVRMRGEWEDHPRFGRRFKVENYVTLVPDTVIGIEKYLGSGLIPGLGPVMAKRLVAAFGLETLDVIDRASDRLTEVDGIGPKRRDQILGAWEEQRDLTEIMVFLQGHGISSAFATRILRRYGSRASEIVRQDPYRLALDIAGIGFQMADGIARHLGVSGDHPRRVQAGLLYLLERAAERGHVFLPRSVLVPEAATLLEVEVRTIEAELPALVDDDRIVLEPDGVDVAVYRTEFWEAELAIAQRAAELLAQEKRPLERFDEVLQNYQRAQRIELGEKQRVAVRTALESPVSIVTGGPGTGKTTVVRAILSLFEGLSCRVQLAAPTGRAAKRLQEATGREAKTLHRVLEYHPKDGFVRNAEQPLFCDVLIVDEVSMVDVILARRTFEALPPRCRLVLVGDVDQLPSVGPGQVLDDLIESGVVPTVRLEQIYRQAEESAIVRNAHRIRRGLFPELDRGRLSDFYFVEKETPEEITQMIRTLLAERIPQRFGIDPREGCQILAPMRRGSLGVQALNEVVQELLNPTGEVCPGAAKLRVGDRVMQMRNNYDLEVYNGDIGRIARCVPETGELAVDFDGTLVRYTRRESDDLQLAYASSIHKSQGSEFPAVLVPLHVQHYRMLRRNLIYTAVTRGQRLVVVIGERRAFEIAIRETSEQRRYTRLRQYLTGE